MDKHSQLHSGDKNYIYLKPITARRVGWKAIDNNH